MATDNETLDLQEPLLEAEELAGDVPAGDNAFVAELKYIGEKISRFFINLGTSGKYWDAKDLNAFDDIIRYVILNFFVIIGVIALAAFAVENIGQGRNFTAGVCIATILPFVVSFVLARTKIQHVIPALIIIISFSVLCVIITWTGEVGGANLLFIYIFPSLSIMQFGMKKGGLMSIAFIDIIFLQIIIPNWTLTKYDYEFDFSIRMLASYLIVLFIMIALEVSRKTKDRLIGVQHKRLYELNDELNCRIKEFDYQPAQAPEKTVKDNGLHVKTKGSMQIIPFDEISHIEVIDHAVYIKLRNKHLVKIYITFGKIEEQLSHDSRFVKCHRSFIINTNEVASLLKQTVTMNNGTKINISRNFSYVKDGLENKSKPVA